MERCQDLASVGSFCRPPAPLPLPCSPAPAAARMGLGHLSKVALPSDTRLRSGIPSRRTMGCAGDAAERQVRHAERSWITEGPTLLFLH